MRNLDGNGHLYELDSYEGTEPQEIQFIHKDLLRDGTFGTVDDGTTNEEVLRMLIHRIGILQCRGACYENDIVLQKLTEALMWLEKRTADRKARKVEGTNQR